VPVRRKLTTSERLAEQPDSHSKHEICLQVVPDPETRTNEENRTNNGNLKLRKE
jgi:subtilase family serine protease